MYSPQKRNRGYLSSSRTMNNIDASTSIIVIGAGGHAKVVIDTLTVSGHTPAGATDLDPSRWDDEIAGVRVIGDDSSLEKFRKETTLLANGVGAAGSMSRRIALLRTLRAAGYRFVNVEHPAATISADVVLGEGSQVLAGALVQPGLKAGVNVIINTGSQVNHDCWLGDHVHIAPGVVLGGGVSVGDEATVGEGADYRYHLCSSTGLFALLRPSV